jgi:heme exporter protein D
MLTVMSGRRAAYAWIYYALHTFNVPALTTHPVLRKTAQLELSDPLP